MLLMNRALFLGLFMMGILQFDLLAEPIPTQHVDPSPNYEDTTELYSVNSLKKANNDSSFIKLVFVVDNSVYKRLCENHTKVYHYCQDILEYANYLFQPYNIFIALVDVIILDNKIRLPHSCYDSYDNFRNYVQNNLTKNNHSINHIQLLTNCWGERDEWYKFTPFENVDKQCQLSTGVMISGCSTKFSAAQLTLILGYSMRVQIDDNTRNCFNRTTQYNYEWEILRYLENSTEYKMKHCIDKHMDKIAVTRTNFQCLKTKPDILFKPPVSGKEVVEPTKECCCCYYYGWPWCRRCRMEARCCCGFWDSPFECEQMY